MDLSWLTELQQLWWSAPSAVASASIGSPRIPEDWAPPEMTSGLITWCEARPVSDEDWESCRFSCASQSGVGEYKCPCSCAYRWDAERKACVLTADCETTCCTSSEDPGTVQSPDS